MKKKFELSELSEEDRIEYETAGTVIIRAPESTKRFYVKTTERVFYCHRTFSTVFMEYLIEADTLEEFPETINVFTQNKHKNDLSLMEKLGCGYWKVNHSEYHIMGLNK